jgi:hypothetical protein
MKTKIQTAYGPYSVQMELPDQYDFKMRYTALIRNEEFKELCNRPGLIDGQVLSVWGDIDSWLETTGKDPLMVCLLLFGNIHKNTYQQSWTWYKNSFSNYRISRRSFPCYELTPGMTAPPGRLTFTLDPSIQRRDAVRMFENFLTKRRAKNKTLKKNPLHGYFQITEKRYEPDKVMRYFYVYDLKNTSRAWQKRAADKFKDVYPSKKESLRRTLLRDVENAYRIIKWSVLGKFPCTKRIK